MGLGKLIFKRGGAALSVWLGSCLASLPAFADASPPSLAGLTFITEEYPPYNYLQAGEIKGTAVDLLEAMLAHTSSPLKRDSIRYFPWVRGYEIALNRPNTVLFSTTRTSSREARFHWVGPIARDRVVLLAAEGSPLRMASLDDAMEQGLSVAVIREDIGAQSLLEAGYPEQLIRPAIDSRSALHMLLHQRVDLWAYSEDVAHWIAEQEGYHADVVTPVHTLSESYLYFALNKETDPLLVAQLQQALERVNAYPAVTQAYHDD
ncbi:MAG: transporter substrate-binding domain-containing protein [Halomonas sp.]|nr:transporter substrate-binding domain-containing protein [Halomonas sp.]